MSATSQRILVADDEEAIRKLLSRGLAALSSVVLTAASGAKALECAALEYPDLILLDVNMPGKNGWEVLRELRLNSRTRMIPVIMLTGQGAISDKVAGLNSGADDYITKPFEIAELRARVASVLRRTRQGISVNPLTKLPGSPAIEEEVERRVQEGKAFAFLYADIDQFKAYNDAYGYAQGDRAIRAAASLLEESTVGAGAVDAFIGHVGGDDFIMIVEAERAGLVAREAVERFDREFPLFYSEEDRKKGFIEGRDRRGRATRLPLMTLSIGIASDRNGAVKSYAQAAGMAAEMKSYVKSRPQDGKSRFAFDRRTGNQGGSDERY